LASPFRLVEKTSLQQFEFLVLIEIERTFVVPGPGFFQKETEHDDKIYGDNGNEHDPVQGFVEHRWALSSGMEYLA
jgi:hypothetical protein